MLTNSENWIFQKWKNKMHATNQLGKLTTIIIIMLLILWRKVSTRVFNIVLLFKTLWTAAKILDNEESRVLEEPYYNLPHHWILRHLLQLLPRRYLPHLHPLSFPYHLSPLGPTNLKILPRWKEKNARILI